MPKYSRTKKYEELRNKLQSDNEANISSKELSEYANRLNKIDANSFESMKTNNDNINHDPIHRRKESVFGTDNIASANKDDKYNNFNNEYLDEYIDEVKQYMMEKGLMVTDNTQQNILRELKGERPKKAFEPQPTPSEASKPMLDTMEVPSFANQVMPSEYNNISLDDIEKRDRITTEMKKVMTSEPKYDFFDDSDSYDTISNLESSLAQEKTAREKLVSETTQMRAQLDEYEDNLTDVSDKMQHTNRILNFVLVVLIFALFIVLGVILYMVLLNKGTI
ncbi:MAG: hypothetical protein MR210_08445 [Erysipelotrichaceae bacterium]|nr:hypothetical protein [Erysipelotrichaceae bacterium]MDY5252309.1 hypothetical protein [Erysipelotrichaceae bacterium]